MERGERTEIHPQWSVGRCQGGVGAGMTKQKAGSERPSQVAHFQASVSSALGKLGLEEKQIVFRAQKM